MSATLDGEMCVSLLALCTRLRIRLGETQARDVLPG
jgi:hypothetical protein